MSNGPGDGKCTPHQRAKKPKLEVCQAPASVSTRKPLLSLSRLLAAESLKGNKRVLRGARSLDKTSIAQAGLLVGGFVRTHANWTCGRLVVQQPSRGLEELTEIEHANMALIFNLQNFLGKTRVIPHSPTTYSLELGNSSTEMDLSSHQSFKPGLACGSPPTLGHVCAFDLLQKDCRP